MEIAASVGVAVNIRKPEPGGKLAADQVLYRMRKLDSVVLLQAFPVFFTDKRIERKGVFDFRFRIVKGKVDSVIHSRQEASSLL